MAGKGKLTVNSSPSNTSQPDTNALLLAEMRRGNNLREEQIRRDKNVSTLRIQ